MAEAADLKSLQYRFESDWGHPVWAGESGNSGAECLEYAGRLKQCGLPCAVEVCAVEVEPDAFHGFDLLAPEAGLSRRFVESQRAALRAALY